MRIEKCVQKEGQRNHAHETQSKAIKDVEHEKSNAESVGESKSHGRRVRRLELWLGATYEALDMLSDIYKTLIPRLVHDLEVQYGLDEMQRLTTDSINRLKPAIDRYHESRQYGRMVAGRLRDAAFPSVEVADDPYEALAALQSLDLFLTYIEGHLTALIPASQAMWDNDFFEAVGFAQTNIQRQKAWANKHIKVKSPQTLLVPKATQEELSRRPSLAGYRRSDSAA